MKIVIIYEKFIGGDLEILHIEREREIRVTFHIEIRMNVSSSIENVSFFSSYIERRRVSE